MSKHDNNSSSGSLLKLIIGIGAIVLVVLLMQEGDKQSSKSAETSIAKEQKQPQNRTSKETGLITRLQYLNEVSEKKWWEVDDNTVYISFSPVPSDWKLIIQTAALHGNNEIGFGVHVWALNDKQRGWRPGKSGHLGEVTARHGKLD